MLEHLRRIGERFEIAGEFRGGAALGSGHIHETFLVEYERSGARARYVHQRINERVFPDVEGLMRNLLLVTEHQRRALRARGARDIERRCLQLVPTRDGATHVRDGEARTWRTFDFIEGTHSLDAPPRPHEAGEAARAFGAFGRDLADLDPDALAVTIPAFHDLRSRFASLEAAASDDPLGRLSAVVSEVDRAGEGFAAIGGTLAELPRPRAVHNDCKLNNVLVDRHSGEALCVIDLDTVMRGSVLFDFGELVRTATCPAAEDEVDLSRIEVDLELFRAVARGYLAGASLDGAERDLLPLAGRAMALENAIRFLTDHLEGDRYFRVHRDGHNLDRARAQLRLAERLAEREDELRRTLEQEASAQRAASPG